MKLPNEEILSYLRNTKLNFLINMLLDVNVACILAIVQNLTISITQERFQKKYGVYGNSGSVSASHNVTKEVHHTMMLQKKQESA